MTELNQYKPTFLDSTIDFIKKPINYAATQARNIARRYFKNKKSLHPANYNLKLNSFEWNGSLISHDTYCISGSLFIEKQGDGQNCNISIFFLDSTGKEIIPSESEVGLPYHRDFGFHKTITCHEHWNDFFVFFSTPLKKLRTSRIVVQQLEKNKPEAFLIANTSIERIRGNHRSLAKVLNTFVARFFNNQDATIKEVETFYSEFAPILGKDSEHLFKLILAQMRSKLPYAAKWLGYLLLQKKQLGADYAKHLYFLYNRSGSIREKASLMETLVGKNYLPNDFVYQKSMEELQLLNDGLELNLEEHAPVYQPTKGVLYLLHNSLPYNSGGYATRSHGLIRGIANHNLFEIRGLARSGYPHDRLLHISKKLTFPLPESTTFEDIEYRIMSQDINKEKTLVKPYVDFFTDEIILEAKKFKPSIIHAASFYHNGMAAIQAAKKLGIKSVYEIRGLQEITKISKEHFWEQTDQYKFYSKLEAQALQNADASFTITNALKKLMISRGVTKPIHVVPNAVNTDKFKPIQKNFDLIQEMKIQPDEVIIGYVGSIVEYEGLDDLLVACKNLVSKKIKFKLLIVGDGGFLDNLKQLTERYNLSQQVIFTGRVPHADVQKYMSIIDIMPFPRKPYLVCEMVSPLKPFESLASEKAVIVSSCAALEEIIQHEKTGLVFKKADTDDLTDKLVALIQNPNLRSKLAANGYAWVCQNRSWKSVSKIVTDVYEDLHSQIKFEQK
jgi:glycosyltransferase involved in cell wall biosynthesis